MKKLLTIVAFCIVNTIVLQAQDNKPTKEETIKWLETRLNALYMGDISKVNSFSGTNILESCREYVTPPISCRIKDIIDFGKLDGIDFSTDKDANNWKIVFTGKIIRHDYDNGTSNEIRTSYIKLSGSAPKEDIERIVKAFKHLANLNGSALVKNDLFD